jgi:hypothetical protein
VLHACAVIAPNQDVAFMLSILWTTIQLLLSGFFVNFPEVRARPLFTAPVSRALVMLPCVPERDLGAADLTCVAL